ncbi:hypothetical protein ACFQY4_33855 [Catellatospora bangladeshensis]|uniref:poly(ethylene terephthalate) hydrolase family protein n=1 Tax=Catellatospora bangladeshensis TaxID=310355 RepID=UPI00360B3C94
MPQVSVRRRLTRLVATAFVATALAGGTALGAAAPAYADEIGQAPTSSNITGNGSFSVATYNISSLVSGFGGGVAYYPTTSGRYPVIAVSPASPPAGPASAGSARAWRPGASWSSASRPTASTTSPAAGAASCWRRSTGP